MRGPKPLRALGCLCSRSRTSCLVDGQLEPESADHPRRDVPLDALREEPPTHVLELTGNKVPDGIPAGWKPPTGMIHPAVDWGGLGSASQPGWESGPAIGGAEVDHAAMRVDENP